jgi:hypothetical protein
MAFKYCISNPAFNVAESNNIAGTGGNTTLYRRATRNDFSKRLVNNGTLINITLKGIIPDLISGYFKPYQVDWIHLMDDIDVWPYNTCIFSVTKRPRTSAPKILGGLAARIFSYDPADCFDFVYYSSSNTGMNSRYSADGPHRVIRQLPGRGRDQVVYDFTHQKVSAGPKFAFYVMESRKSYTVTSEPVYGGTICYVPFDTEDRAHRLKLFVENNPVYAEYVRRMKFRGHAFGLRNVRRFDVDQIKTGSEIPREWNIQPSDLAQPQVLVNDIIRDTIRVKSLGEVFTPTSLVDRVIDLLLEQDPEILQDSLADFLDSMAGDGQFLVGLHRRGVRPEQLYGIDLTQSNVDRIRSRLPGIPEDNILCADSFGPSFEG